MLSFSGEIKNELSKLNNLKKKDEVYAEFLGYLVINNINIEKSNIKFATENEYNINRFSKLLNNLDILDYKIDIYGKIFNIVFNKNNKLIAENELDILKLDNIINTDNLKKAFIRGNFLGGGSINNPKNKYHLEILFREEQYLSYTKNILKEYNINAKKYKNILYIKDGEEISKFLALIGANLAVIKFEEIRVLRETKNNVNRIVNCETANINRTINTSVQQLHIIKEIKKNGNFNKLPEELKEIVLLRENNPSETLENLGKMLKKPIGKSSVNYRFKKLKEYL